MYIQPVSQKLAFLEMKELRNQENVLGQILIGSPWEGVGMGSLQKKLSADSFQENRVTR